MMPPPLQALSGWGRYPVLDARLLRPGGAQAIADTLRTASGPLIARGNGRSYGDASVGLPDTLDMTALDRFVAFDEATGELTCEAGVLLADILRVFVPRGWFPAVTPGTQFVTVGGMIASDVHGKNHHVAGSFGNHVTALDLMLGDGTVLTCSAAEHADLFAATCGGMGLTGVILSATIRLIPIETALVRQTVSRAGNLAEAMALFDAAADTTYSVAWIDCLSGGSALGRSILMTGEHLRLEEGGADRAAPLARKPSRRKSMPIDLPGFVLNRLSVSAFNEAYYRLHRDGRSDIAIDPFFYPLDHIGAWNRIYGRRGFVQYQCVLPAAESREGLQALLTTIARAGEGSFLAVLKRLGPQAPGLLSFPLDGYTLALDFPLRGGTLPLLDRLDDIVAEHGGRIYLTKDARVQRDVFEKGYPGLPAFRAIRRRYGLQDRFQSALSRRLEL